MSLTPRARAKARRIRFYFRDEGNVFDPKKRFCGAYRDSRQWIIAKGAKST
jgi:hypothetical protein